MMYRFSRRSRKNLKSVHPDLVYVMEEAIEITAIDFTIIEGRRTIKRQKQLVESGASHTMNSRHLTGHAVDLVPLSGGKVSWHWPLYRELAEYIKRAAKECDIPIEWGGDWKTLHDGPHWQLSRKDYP